MYKIIFIAILILISFRIYRRTRAPKGLENVPTLSFLGVLISVFSGAGPDKRWKDIGETMEKEGIAKFWINGEWAILATDLGFVKEVLKSDCPKALPEEVFPRATFTKYYGTNLVFSNGDVWKRHRYVANPAFKKLPVHVFTETTMKLLKVMEKVDSKPIEAKSLMHRLTLDVLGKAAFGFDFNNLEDPDNVYVNTYNEVNGEFGNKINFILSSLDYFPHTKGRKSIAKLNSLYDEIVKTKLESLKTGELEEKINNNTADLLERMIHASKDPENPTLTSNELRYNMAILMLAGHDTTANALTTILYLLATHKDVQKKVRDEILSVLGDNVTPSFEQQKELKYMNMVINENLRLYPPIAALPPRRLTQETRFNNHVIPANTFTTLYIYGVNHSSNYWKNPEEFIPERFENEKHDNFALLSFSGGNRICMGVNFSLIEQRVVLSAILRKYEVSLPADSIHKDRLQIEPEKSGTVGPYPIPLIFKRRAE